MIDSQETISRDEGIAANDDTSARARVLLVVTSGTESELVELGSAPLTIGRVREADVVVDERSLSRLHARFSRIGDVVTVTDLGSRNGTVVNGTAVRQASMRPGDVAVLGNVVVTLQAVEATHAALLGLSTFEGMRRRIHDEFARARTFRRPLSLVFLRSDAAIGRDTFREAWAEKLRPSDHAGIYDARSILVLLPETDALGAETLAKDWLSDAAAETLLVAGVASFPDCAFTPDQLLTAAMTAANVTSTGARVAVAPRATLVRAPDEDGMVRTSPAMLEVQRLLERVAPQMTPVLILGETGTGKELVAREVHRLSPRRERPLKIVNCAALGEAQLESVLFGHAHGAFSGAERAQPGVFERARGGSVFLDEVGELSSAAQAALLRAIETGRVCPVGSNVDVDVDVRLISSTHRRLDDLVEQGLFRLDLFHRLNAFTVELSPLRDRLEEVGPLAEAFVRRFAPDAGSDGPVVSPETLQILEHYAWPGNVRELRNVVERAVTLSEGSALTPDDLPKHLLPCQEMKGGSLVSPSRVPPLPAVGIDLRNELQQHEALLIVRALERTNGHQRKAAELLNLPLRTFERRLKDLGLNRPGMN